MGNSVGACTQVGAFCHTGTCPDAHGEHGGELCQQLADPYFHRQDSWAETDASTILPLQQLHWSPDDTLGLAVSEASSSSGPPKLAIVEQSLTSADVHLNTALRDTAPSDEEFATVLDSPNEHGSNRITQPWLSKAISGLKFEEVWQPPETVGETKVQGLTWKPKNNISLGAALEGASLSEPWLGSLACQVEDLFLARQRSTKLRGKAELYVQSRGLRGRGCPGDSADCADSELSSALRKPCKMLSTRTKHKPILAKLPNEHTTESWTEASDSEFGLSDKQIHRASLTLLDEDGLSLHETDSMTVELIRKSTAALTATTDCGSDDQLQDLDLMSENGLTDNNGTSHATHPDGFPGGPDRASQDAEAMQLSSSTPQQSGTPFLSDDRPTLPGMVKLKQELQVSTDSDADAGQPQRQCWDVEPTSSLAGPEMFSLVTPQGGQTMKLAKGSEFNCIPGKAGIADVKSSHMLSALMFEAPRQASPCAVAMCELEKGITKEEGSEEDFTSVQVEEP